MEQVQYPAATAECESVISVQRILPDASCQVVVKYKQAAADIRAERYQHEQQRRPFRGLPLVYFDDDWDVDYGKKERTDDADIRGYKVE